MLFIGSVASKIRTPKDFDILSTSLEFSSFKNIYGDQMKNIQFHLVHYSFFMNGKRFEVEICDEGTSGYEYQKIMNSFGLIKLEEIKSASNEILLSIKKSHRFYNIKFYKNINDYNILLERCGKDLYPELTKLRTLETENRLGKVKTPKLSKSSKQFFSQSHDFFKSYFIHDEIHMVMSHLDKPMYEYMQPDIESPMCSKKLWNNFSEDMKDKCVLEEAYVIALERKLIPNIFGGEKYYSPNDAIMWSLMRIATTLCSGFFREWCSDNWTRIVSKIDENYLDKFLESVDSGKIEMKVGKNYIEQ